MKAQKALRKSKPLEVHGSDFQLDEGVFILENGSAAVIIEKLEGSNSGVALLNDDLAIPWIQQQCPIVPNIQHIKPDEITFPATDRLGRKVLLRGFIWQLGNKKIKTNIARNQQLAVNKSIVLSINVYKDEAHEDVWQGLEKAFVRTIKGVLQCENSSVWQVWGRSFHGAGPKTQFDAANSAHCFFRVAIDDVEQILALSGTSGVYVVAKAENHLPHPDWCVIWIGSQIDCMCALKKVSSHSGMIRGKNSWGIRCHVSRFPDMSKMLRPTFDDHSAPIPVTRMYKIEPVPPGISNRDLIEWGKKESRPIRVIKKLGKQIALVGSNKPPPDGYTAINGEVVLIQEFFPNQQSKVNYPQIAGPKMKSRAGGHMVATDSFAKDVQHDPWAGSVLPPKANEGGGPSNAWARYTPVTGIKPQVAPPIVNMNPRQIDSTISAKFQGVNDRVAMLEASVKQIQDDQGKISEQVKQQHEMNQAQFKEVDRKFGTINDNLKGFQSHIQHVISDTVKKQDERMGVRFDQLMEMLQKGGQSSATKRPLDIEGDASMSPAK